MYLTSVKLSTFSLNPVQLNKPALLSGLAEEMPPGRSVYKLSWRDSDPSWLLSTFYPDFTSGFSVKAFCYVLTQYCE